MANLLLIEQMKKQARRQMIKRMKLLNRGAFWHGSKKSMYFDASYGNTGCRFFKSGVQNQKDFCLKINIHKGNY
jgi:hypothetical protein